MRLADRLLDVLYPRKCGVCDILGTNAICDSCIGEFRPFARTLNGPEGSLDFRVALYDYTGLAAKAVQRLKYSRATTLTEPFATQMADAFRELGFDYMDAVVPVPIHWSRRATRGFNQSELLCEKLPRVEHRWLFRVLATRPQVGLPGTHRLDNLKNAFKAEPAVRGKHILLVDDVYTTGETGRQCAAELKRQGALEVGILTLAGNRAKFDME